MSLFFRTTSEPSRHVSNKDPSLHRPSELKVLRGSPHRQGHERLFKTQVWQCVRTTSAQRKRGYKNSRSVKLKTMQSLVARLKEMSPVRVRWRVVCGFCLSRSAQSSMAFCLFVFVFSGIVPHFSLDAVWNSCWKWTPPTPVRNIQRFGANIMKTMHRWLWIPLWYSCHCRHLFSCKLYV